MNTTGLEVASNTAQNNTEVRPMTNGSYKRKNCPCLDLLAVKHH